MSSGINGARTLTCLDHLFRSIWQGLAAGAVGDDDAQALTSGRLRRQVSNDPSLGSDHRLSMPLPV
jgi:hypothetical protein